MSVRIGSLKRLLNSYCMYINPHDHQDGNKRLLMAPQQWLDDLRVPQDAYDLLYRLGQKTVQFDRMKVRIFLRFLMGRILSAETGCVYIFLLPTDSATQRVWVPPSIAFQREPVWR